MRKSYILIFLILLFVAVPVGGCKRRAAGTGRRFSLRRVPSKKISAPADQKLEILLRQLDEKFMEMQSWKAMVDRNRSNEEEALIRIREEIAHLREEISSVQLAVEKKNLRPAVASSVNTYQKPASRSRTTTAMSAPEGYKSYSSIDPIDNTSTPELRPESIDPVTARKSFTPPSISSSSTVKAPPFSSGNKSSVVSAEPVEQRSYNVQPQNISRRKIEVSLVKGAPTGRVLWIERSQNNRALRIDIGSLAGLKAGSLVSVGGVGAGCSIWEVKSTRKYSSVVERIANSPVGGVSRGDIVYQVTQKF